jgi:hypothetical protein
MTQAAEQKPQLQTTEPKAKNNQQSLDNSLNDYFYLYISIASMFI